MFKGYENYEKLKENFLRTNQLRIAPLQWTFIALPHKGEENVSKLHTENTGNSLCSTRGFQINMWYKNWSLSFHVHFADITYETSAILQILQHTLVQTNKCRTETQWIS